MLLEIDRIQIAVPEMSSVIDKWRSLLGAEVSLVDNVSCLGANRTCLRLGSGCIEVLSPDGAGIIDDAVKRRGAHMFAAGVSCEDIQQVRQRLARQTGHIVSENGQLFVDGKDIGIKGLRVVVSNHEQRSVVGDIDYLYEATLIAGNSTEETAKFARIFDLDAQEFASINSPRFGYDGTLTLFRKDLLHRFEVITPLDPATTMGRFFKKTGPCLYMAFAETSKILAIEQRVLAMEAGMTVDRPEDRDNGLLADQVWLHPKTLGGVMLGLSRPSMAWQWSGHPERVEIIK